MFDSSSSCSFSSWGRIFAFICSELNSVLSAANCNQSTAAVFFWPKCKLVWHMVLHCKSHLHNISRDIMHHCCVCMLECGLINPRPASLRLHTLQIEQESTDEASVRSANYTTMRVDWAWTFGLWGVNVCSHLLGNKLAKLSGWHWINLCQWLLQLVDHLHEALSERAWCLIWGGRCAHGAAPILQIPACAASLSGWMEGWEEEKMDVSVGGRNVLTGPGRLRCWLSHFFQAVETFHNKLDEPLKPFSTESRPDVSAKKTLSPVALLSLWSCWSWILDPGSDWDAAPCWQNTQISCSYLQLHDLVCSDVNPHEQTWCSDATCIVSSRNAGKTVISLCCCCSCSITCWRCWNQPDNCELVLERPTSLML